MLCRYEDVGARRKMNRMGCWELTLKDLLARVSDFLTRSRSHSSEWFSCAKLDRNVSGLVC